MEIVVTNLELSNYLIKKQREAKNDLIIGFVPTMGALHTGHASLIHRAKDTTDIVVCSVFVNPTQFNDPKDLEKYPRTPDLDKELLKASGCDVLFMPSIEEIYPTHRESPTIDLGGVDKVLEGAYRPGHFNGVAQVVYRLFEIVKPNKAFFGIKDYQQVMVVKKVADQMPFPIAIIPCPIVREDNGLAMSSRNMRLSSEEKEIAMHISRILFYAKANKHNFNKYSELRLICLKMFVEIEGLKLDYFEIVDQISLIPIENEIKTNAVILCAAFVGSVRLIDNLILD